MTLPFPRPPTGACRSGALTSRALTVGALTVGALAVCLLAAPLARADYIDHFANPNDIGLLKIPRSGTTRVLVLPVIIDDQDFAEGSEAGFLEELAAFYDPSAPGWSFTSYWQSTSVGRFRPEATVAAPVHFATCPLFGVHEDCLIPRGAGIADGDLEGAVQVLVDAFQFLDETFVCAQDGPGAGTSCTAGGGVDFSQFDTSGSIAGTPDQVIDGVIIVSNAGFPGIALPIKDLTGNQLLGFFGPFPEFVYGDTLISAVAIAGFARRPQHTTWVSVHEFGHLLGWADLYNEDGTSTDMPYTLMGGWAYRDPGSLPDAYSRMAAGFSHVVQVAGDGSYEIGPADTTGTVLKVGTGDEFFLVELRRRVEDSLDGDLAIPFGVVVERVRLQKRPSPERGQYFGTLQNCVNCVPFDQFLAIEQADGQFDLERGRARDDGEDLFLAGSAIAPSEDTAARSLAHAVFSSNRVDGAKTDITIRVVELSAARALIEIEAPAVADPCAEIGAFCQVEDCAVDDEGNGACGFVVLPPDPPPVLALCTCASARVDRQPPTVALALLALLSGALLVRAPRAERLHRLFPEWKRRPTIRLNDASRPCCSSSSSAPSPTSSDACGPRLSGVFASELARRLLRKNVRPGA